MKMIWRALKRNILTEIVTWIVFVLLVGAVGVSLNAPPPISYVMAVVWFALFAVVYCFLFRRRVRKKFADGVW